MLSWITQIIAVAGVLTTSASGAAQYVASLPPAPAQSSIACHDTSWENQKLVQVQGYATRTELKPFIEKMLQDGQKSGVYIAINSGYRTCAEQASLRAYACGTGDYNMNLKPIKDCHPPTEPAGKSLHNEGLAVDLACYGYSIFEYSPCYKWLKANHLKYALLEHELEPWHWSTTGK